MKKKTSVKIFFGIFFATVTIALAMLAFVPFLNEILAVDVAQEEEPVVTEPFIPEAPVPCLVTAIYEMEEHSKKVAAVYVEIFSAGSDTVTWLEIPVDTKIMLSEELYKSLQTYAPELPQYLKVSNMAEAFSEEYGLTGCNRILSEMLGVTVTEYLRTNPEHLGWWIRVVTEEQTAGDFFADYSQWLEVSSSSLKPEERWMYYESWQQVTAIEQETAPGSREKDGYLLSGKRSKERLQELMLQTDKAEGKEREHIIWKGNYESNWE